jgi:hypothetical protein
MRRLQDLPIKQKVTLVILPTCSATLLLACEALAAYEVIDFRRALVRDMTVLADVLAKRRRRQPFSPADSSVRCLSWPARRFGKPQTKTAGRTGPRILTKTPLSRATRGGAGRARRGPSAIAWTYFCNSIALAASIRKLWPMSRAESVGESRTLVRRTEFLSFWRKW